MALPELCVILNPAAGKRRAAARLEPLKRQWGDRVVFRPTEHAGHAVDLAKQAALEGFTKVAAAGGDGTVHDVANGLLLSGRSDVHFVVIPIGSANDFAYSLRGLGDGVRRIDVGRARRSDGKERFFVCNLGMGFNGAVTVESRRVAWLQGMALYGLATLRALWKHFACPIYDIQFDDQPIWRTPTLMLAVLLGQREGGFVLAPDAKLDDGLFDYIHVGTMSRWRVLSLLPRLAFFGPPTNHPNLRLGRCSRLRMTSEVPVNVHVDGEFLCVAEEGFRSIDVEIVPGALAVDMDLSRQCGVAGG